MSLNQLASNVGVEAVAGLIVGASIDSVFGNKEVTEKNLLTVGLECVGQLMVNGLVTAATYDFLTRRNMVAGGDPSKNVAFLFGMVSAQRSLHNKIGDFVQLSRAKLAALTVDFRSGQPASSQ
jgi:hypothetical protein